MWLVGGVWAWLLSYDVVSQIVLIFSFIVDMCVKLIHSDAVLIHHYFNCLLKTIGRHVGCQVYKEEKQYFAFLASWCQFWESKIHLGHWIEVSNHLRNCCTKFYHFIKINAASLWIYFTHISSIQAIYIITWHYYEKNYYTCTKLL